MAFERQTAYKISIKNILNSEYVKRDGWDPNYIIDKFQRKIAKVNIVGTILSKNESLNFKSIIIDDGSGSIEVRSFDSKNAFENLNIGDIVLVIGKPRAFGNEKYLISEIVKKSSKDQLELRKLELRLESIKVKNKKKEIKNTSEEVFRIIKELDDKNGSANINKVIEICEKKGIKDGDKIIKTLLETGDIFEISSGQLKVI